MLKLIVFVIVFIAAVSAGPVPTTGRPCEGGSKTELTEAQKNEFHKIAFNKSATKQQNVDALDLFFQKFNCSQTYTDAKLKADTRRKEMDSKFPEAIANLSDPAKQLITKLKAIHENMSLTSAQESDRIQKAFDETSDEVKKEIKSAKSLQKDLYFLK